MEKVIAAYEKLNEKANILQETMTVLPHKTSEKVMEQLSQLKDDSEQVNKLSADIKGLLKKFEESQQKQYKQVTDTTKRVQMKMLYLLDHLNKVEEKMSKENRALMPMHLPMTPKLLDREGASQAFSEMNTPRMHVAEYAKSPFAKKRLKVQLQFTDFEAEITAEDFSKIPGYMRGRVTQPELQDFLDNTIIRTFNDKYRILFQHRSSLKPSEYNLQAMFKSQESYFEGQKFITVGDIARILEKNVEKKDDRFLQMLRHLQIIREARKSSTICFIWLR